MTVSFRHLLLSGLAASVVATGIAPVSVRAHDTDRTLVLEPITITARKRAESEATVPIATTVLTPQQMQPSTLNVVEEIARQVPGMVFSDFSRFGEGYMTMRGTATLGVALNPLDNTVGFSVDEVPTSLLGINAPLLDVERIEVLRGPQGTTFGRNALAGAINVVSKPANGERAFKVDTGIGTDGYRFFEGTAGGWIMPGTVAGRGVVRFENFDGDVPNAVIGGTDGGVRVGAARGAMRFTPNDTLSVSISGNYSRNRRHDPSNIFLEASGFPKSGSDMRPYNEQEIGQGTIKIVKDTDTLRLTSMTSLQNIHIRSRNDFTDSLLYAALYGRPPAFFADTTQDKLVFRDRERIFLQEFRVGSQDDSPVRWVVGTNYFRSDYELDRTMKTMWPTLNGRVRNDITSETVALFGDASIPLDRRWELSGGLRVANDHQKLDGRYVSNGFPRTVPFFDQSGSYSDVYLTGRMALSYMWTDTIMSYASIARGYSSGGFERSTQYAALGRPSRPFAPMTSWTYEIGSKVQATDWLRIDGALYYNDVKDGQLSAFDNKARRSYFASQDYRSYGGEANVTAAIGENLDVIGGLSLIHSELVDVTAKSMEAGAKKGNRVPQVPSFATNMGLRYRIPAAAVGLPGTFTTGINHHFIGTRYSEIANAGKLDPYHIVNLRVGWEKEGLGVYAFANNLFDERPIFYSFPLGPTASMAYVGRGQVLGLGVSLTW